MIAAFDDVSVFKDPDNIRVLNRAETMGDNKDSTSFPNAVPSFLNHGFGTGVNGRSSFIEDQNWRIGNCSSCDSKELSLSLR